MKRKESFKEKTHYEKELDKYNQVELVCLFFLLQFFIMMVVMFVLFCLELIS